MQSFAAIGFKFLLPAVEFSFKHFPTVPDLKRFSYWFPIHNIYVPIIASLTKPATIASSTGTATATGTAIVFPLFHFPLLLLALFLLLLPFLLLLLLLLPLRQWRNLLYKHSRAPNTFYPLLSRHLPCALPSAVPLFLHPFSFGHSSLPALQTNHVTNDWVHFCVRFFT